MSRQTSEDIAGLKQLVLAYAAILSMTKMQRIYCYDYLWHDRTITEIAEKYSVTENNVIITISRSLFKILKKILRDHIFDAFLGAID